MVGSKNSQSEQDERIDVRGDGRIILYKRAGLKNPKWQVRLRIPGASGYKIVSTKSSKLSAAEGYANNLYDELYHHVRRGGSIRTRTFAQVFQEWESTRLLMQPSHQKQVRCGTADRVRAKALEFFGLMKIDEINTADFESYWRWRQHNYSRVAPTNNTLGRERTAILSLFRFAEQMNYISKIPTSTSPKQNKERRPTFSKQEWAAIASKMDAWEKEGEDKSTARDRYLAKRYFQILVMTGLRVGELRKLCWGDLWEANTDTGKRVGANVRGKTGAREVVFLKGAGSVFNELMSLHMSDLRKLHPDDEKKWNPGRTRIIFCHPDGTHIQTFKRSFHSLLNFAKVPIKINGKARTIYSLRHYYATNRLYEDVSPYLLAQQMGTSVEMLEKFYGQTMTSMAATQITKTRPQSKSTPQPFQG